MPESAAHTQLGFGVPVAFLLKLVLILTLLSAPIVTSFDTYTLILMASSRGAKKNIWRLVSSGHAALGACLFCSVGRSKSNNHPPTSSWLPDGCSQIFRSYVFSPSGFWTMAPLRYASKFDPWQPCSSSSVITPLLSHPIIPRSRPVSGHRSSSLLLLL